MAARQIGAATHSRRGWMGVWLAVLVTGLFALGAPHASAQPEHAIRYVVTADGDQDVEIHYRADPPSETSSGARYEHVRIRPDSPWEQTTTLAEPYKYAYVSVRQVWWNPNFHCEVWVDGQLAKKDAGVCVLVERYTE